ncbi:hypothetical protein mRhiFer1_007896 [Rhinolophus ferrumequinum]|uniref:Uncharacterized protein n=1 Tax=Rhinolophus ferrumequinum TaxID=59479 RepID=A0A7J8AV90_RHIFE|nr:hypothetical protein mRhiFer1_007896 [Rhinolophus ferrumequinum]
MERLSNRLLKNDWVKEEIKRDIKRYIETNESENITYQSYWEAAKVVIRRKFISLQAYLKKQESKLKLHLRELQNEEQMKPKVSRRKEIIKMRVELNEIENKKAIKKLMQHRAGSFERSIKLTIFWPESLRKRENRY